MRASGERFVGFDPNPPIYIFSTCQKLGVSSKEEVVCTTPKGVVHVHPPLNAVEPVPFFIAPSPPCERVVSRAMCRVVHTK